MASPAQAKESGAAKRIPSSSPPLPSSEGWKERIYIPTLLAGAISHLRFPLRAAIPTTSPPISARIMIGRQSVGVIGPKDQNSWARGISPDGAGHWDGREKSTKE
ncbi:hypothetical protein ACLOJK_008096 [Asimina triloba]